MAYAKFLSRDESPNTKPITRKDAESIAAQLVSIMRSTAAPYALFIGSAGDFLMAARYGKRFARWAEQWPRSLCGVYMPDTDPEDIAADILGMDA